MRALAVAVVALLGIVTAVSAAPTGHVRLKCEKPPDVRPITCTIYPLDPILPLSAGADLRHLQWRGWGNPSARARGCDWAFHHYPGSCQRLPVTVEAYRIRHYGEGDAFYYTRLRERFRDGTSRVFDVAP
jgi:hypothetical protein